MILVAIEANTVRRLFRPHSPCANAGSLFKGRALRSGRPWAEASYTFITVVGRYDAFSSGSSLMLLFLYPVEPPSVPAVLDPGYSQLPGNFFRLRAGPEKQGMAQEIHIRLCMEYESL